MSAVNGFERRDCPDPQWDWRRHPSKSLCYRDDGPDLARADLLRRALDALQSYADGCGSSENDLAGPLWALGDLSARPEETRAACIWFRVAAELGEDEATKRMLCFEAYSKIARSVRGQVSKLEAWAQQRVRHEPDDYEVRPIRARVTITT